MKAVFDRDWNIGKNQQDTIAQRGAARNRWITSEKQLECRCVETNYPSNTAKRTPCSMLQLVANQWDVRVTTSEHVHNGNGGAEQAASEVVSKNRPATGSGSPSSQRRSSEECDGLRDFG